MAEGVTLERPQLEGGNLRLSQNQVTLLSIFQELKGSTKTTQSLPKVVKIENFCDQEFHVVGVVHSLNLMFKDCTTPNKYRFLSVIIFMH